MAVKNVRVLATWPLEGLLYRPNQVVQVDESKIKQAVKDGVVDAAKAAVEYCIKELGAEVVIHDTEKAASPPPPPPPPAPDADAGAGTGVGDGAPPAGEGIQTDLKV